MAVSEWTSKKWKTIDFLDILEILLKEEDPKYRKEKKIKD